MKSVHGIFLFGYGVIVALFAVSALALIIFAAVELWHGILPTGPRPVTERFNAILESIALLTIAVAALELGQTVLEEEIQRSAHLSAPTRVRRFLSRFMIVVIVSLSVECLVTTFEVAREDPSKLPYAAAIGLAAAGMLAAWGVFVKLNTVAEHLEPVAMEQVKEEDHKLDRETRE